MSFVRSGRFSLLLSRVGLNAASGGGNSWSGPDFCPEEEPSSQFTLATRKVWMSAKPLFHQPFITVLYSYAPGKAGFHIWLSWLSEIHILKVIITKQSVDFAVVKLGPRPWLTWDNLSQSVCQKSETPKFDLNLGSIFDYSDTKVRHFQSAIWLEI